MTRWDAIKTKFLLLSKGEKLIFAFIVSFIVSLLPAGFFAAFMVGEWSAGLFRMLKLSVTTSEEEYEAVKDKLHPKTKVTIKKASAQRRQRTTSKTTR